MPTSKCGDRPIADREYFRKLSEANKREGLEEIALDYKRDAYLKPESYFTRMKSKEEIDEVLMDINSTGEIA